MALLFLDSFDDRTTGFWAKYDAYSGDGATLASGRTGKGMSLVGTNPASFTRNVAQAQTLLVGFGIRAANPPTTGVPFLEISDGTNVQCYLQVTSGSLIELRRGGTGAILATTANVLSSSVFAHVEMRFAVAATAGSALLNIQGFVDFQVQNVALRHASSTNNWASSFRFFNSTPGAQIDLDDLYLADTTGSRNNDLLGQIHVECLRPDANGTTIQFLPVSPPSYTMVRDTTPDGDTTYVGTASGNIKDTYTFGDCSAAVTGTILAVQVGAVAKKDDIPLRQIQLVTRSGGSDTNSALTFTLNNVYTSYLQLWETDPATANNWLIAAINAAEFGFRTVV